MTPQTALQRVVPNDALGRISAVFLSAEALATLIGALAGPLLAETLSLSAAVIVACAVAAGGALTGLALVPLLDELVPGSASVGEPESPAARARDAE